MDTPENTPPPPSDDDAAARMPNPGSGAPIMALKPEEAVRFLSQLMEGQTLAMILAATIDHGLKIAAACDDPEERADHFRTLRAMAKRTGQLVGKNGQDLASAIEGTRRAFGAIGVKLPPAPDDPAELMERIGTGKESMQEKTGQWLDGKNTIAAGIICGKDHPGARDLADRAGLDPDKMDGGVSLDMSKDSPQLKPKPSQKDKPKPAKNQELPAPPTWTGRNGTKWKPDGTRDDSTPNN